jgi:hypothetical protein
MARRPREFWLFGESEKTSGGYLSDVIGLPGNITSGETLLFCM